MVDTSGDELAWSHNSHLLCFSETPGLVSGAHTLAFAQNCPAAPDHADSAGFIDEKTRVPSHMRLITNC